MSTERVIALSTEIYFDFNLDTKEEKKIDYFDLRITEPFYNSAVPEDPDLLNHLSEINNQIYLESATPMRQKFIKLHLDLSKKSTFRGCWMPTLHSI